MVKALKAIGADVQYSEFPGVDHNAWDPAYIPELQAFILARKQASHLA